MDMVSPVLNVVSPLWNCMVGHASYVCDLEDTLTSLRSKMEDLKGIKDDVKLKVQLEEEQGKMRSKQVQGWLTRVEEIEIKVNGILVEHEDMGSNGSTCVGICRYQSSYKLGKKSKKLLNIIQELISKGEFPVVAIQQPRPAPLRETEGLLEMPMDNTVGIKSILPNVLEHLKDDNLGIIGLYGMGGVGKTTLLKRINNELSKNGDGAFDVAIWVVASKQATVEALQQIILEKLRIPFDLWRNKPVDVKAGLIYQALKVRKYILMLDDVWQRLDLSEVGLPTTNNQNKSKVVFTTRSEEICGLMEAHLKIKVTCLSWEKAWDLFKDKVGEAVLISHPDITRLAQLVAKECDGLPLALITVGRAMSSRKTPYEWSHALKVLQKYPSQFSGMGEHVLPVLKFSYDNLPDQTIRDCFVYCCIFPEDYEISSNRLVDLWIVEGFLKDFDDMIEARNHGLYIIESLKLACLLEHGSKSSLHVKMHDVIRDMAMWIASDLGKSNGKFMVSENNGLAMGVQSSTGDWYKKVEKMFVYGNMFRMTIFNCLCPQLSTLVINGTRLQKMISLFQFIPYVRVLDLSGNKMLKELPDEISTLTMLEYLNLSRTSLNTLPHNLKSLSRLRLLLLSYMEKMKVYQPEIISGLANLWMFHMNYTYILKENLVDLDSFQHLHEVSICLEGINCLVEFLKLKKLQRSVRYLRLDHIATTIMDLSSSHLRNMKALQIIRSNMSILKISSLALKDFCKLQHVIISRCESLIKLDYLVYAPLLENLWVRKCVELQRIVYVNDNDVGDVRIFSNLRRIRLDDLPELGYICNQPLPFPSLERVYVNNCPCFKLCFKDIPSNLKYIKGNQRWWDQSILRNAWLKQHLSQYFQTWTAYMEVETMYGSRRVKDDWPECSSSTYNDAYISMEDENLDVLRASVNIWEE